MTRQMKGFLMSVPAYSRPELKNRILAGLPAKEYERLRPHLKPVSLLPGEVIYEPSERIRHVYFPLDAVVSVASITRDGHSIELGLIGPEGMVGLPVLLGTSATAAWRATVLAPGAAVRMEAGLLTSEFDSCGPLLKLLLRHSHATVIQVSQTAVCNTLHTVDQRLCHRLLLTHDRVGSQEFMLTHEGLAGMIGVRRAGVSEAAARLRGMGLISYRRGKVRINDRRGLESCACECYGVIKQEVDRLYGDRK